MAALGTRLLKIEVDGTDYTAEVSAVTIDSAESDADFITFADAAAGGARDYTLNFTAVQDAAAGTLWTEVFESSGDTVPVTVMPYGNAVATVGEPHFECNAVISDPDGTLLGGEADASTSARMTIECAWKLTGKPTKVTT
jgi:hypothetical protein